ncbi:MAG: hypothetical protein E7D27_05010 [Clostridium celatum]|nr:hypothetical protein [Clostridium celatum]
MINEKLVCKDINNHFYTIDNYIFTKKNNPSIIPLCICCNKQLYLKCIDNANRNTHLSHYKNQSCKSVYFKNCFKHSISTKISSLEIENLKVLTLLYANNIYNHINSIFHKHITMNEFSSLFNNIPESVFKIIDFPISSLSYIFINHIPPCDNITYIYTTTDASNKLWEFCGKKNILLKIDNTSLSNPVVTTIPTDYTYLNNTSIIADINFISNTFDSLCNALNLPPDVENQTLQYLLSKI